MATLKPTPQQEAFLSSVLLRLGCIAVHGHL